jgi:hypothetical protein
MPAAQSIKLHLIDFQHRISQLQLQASTGQQLELGSQLRQQNAV